MIIKYRNANYRTADVTESDLVFYFQRHGEMFIDFTEHFDLGLDDKLRGFYWDTHDPQDVPVTTYAKLWFQDETRHADSLEQGLDAVASDTAWWDEVLNAGCATETDYADLVSALRPRRGPKAKRIQRAYEQLLRSIACWIGHDGLPEMERNTLFGMHIDSIPNDDLYDIVDVTGYAAELVHDAVLKHGVDTVVAFLASRGITLGEED